MQKLAAGALASLLVLSFPTRARAEAPDDDDASVHELDGIYHPPKDAAADASAEVSSQSGSCGIGPIGNRRCGDRGASGLVVLGIAMIAVRRALRS